MLTGNYLVPLIPNLMFAVQGSLIVLEPFNTVMKDTIIEPMVHWIDPEVSR